MKEINDIIYAYDKATAAGKKTALATVVKVEGSSYRRPGARMLIAEDGQLTGAISGGCLEGDALRKALLTIHQQQNKLITYDTSNPDDVEFGVQLGCNGIVHILFEYIDSEDLNNPIALLRSVQQTRREVIFVTLFSIENRSHQTGTVGLFDLSTNELPEKLRNLGSAFLDQIKNGLEAKTSSISCTETDEHPEEILLDYIPPANVLLIAGAGNDAQPVLEIASVLGWETIVVDGRVTHATEKRFPKAKQVIRASAEELTQKVNIDESTVCVLMTHNYHYDLTLLKQLLNTKTPYIGLLGPKTKMDRMLADLESEGIVLHSDQLSKMYGPVGLDIGAETAEEIAISIVSEIQAVMNNRKGTSLKYSKEKVHRDTSKI